MAFIAVTNKIQCNIHNTILIKRKWFNNSIYISNKYRHFMKQTQNTNADKIECFSNRRTLKIKMKIM